jgi:hypothetical protein
MMSVLIIAVLGAVFGEAALRVWGLAMPPVRSDTSQFSFPFNAGTEGEIVRIAVE